MLTKRIIAAALLFIAGPAFAGSMMLLGVGGAGGAAAGATTYYVDSAAGLDSNDGKTTATAWQTIGKVNGATFNPGDSVLFKGGQTFTVGTAVSCGGVGNVTALCLTAAKFLGTPANPVTLGSFGTGNATIHALGNNAAFMAYDVGSIKVTNLTFTGSGTSTPMTAGINGGVIFLNDLAGNVKLDGVTVNNVTITGFSGDGLLFRETNGISGYQNAIISFVTSSANTSGTDGKGVAGIHLAAFANYGGGKTSAAFQNFLIDHCYVHDNPGAAVAFFTGGGIIAYNTNNLTIQNNIAANNSANGVASMGIFVYDSSNVTIQSNESYGNKTTNTADGGGIDVDGGVQTAVVQYNYTHNNMGPGIVVNVYGDNTGAGGNITGSDNITVRYNVSQNDASLANYGGISLGNDGDLNGGTNVASLTNTYVYNNTIYQSNATQAVGIVSDGPSGTNPITAKVANNIFYVSGSAKMVGNPFHQTAASITFKTNDYFTTGTFSSTLNGTTYSSFASWQSAQDASGVATNPLLTTPGGGTTTNTTPGVPSAQASAYLLQATSTMKGLGANLASLYGITVGATDFFGLALSTTAFNVGADASPASSCTPAQAIITSGTTTVVPCWWNSSSKAEAIGAGGGGNANTTNVGTGGEGGHYAKSTSLSLTPNATVNIAIGAGGVQSTTTGGGKGGDTWLGGTSLATSLVGAKGGAGSTNSSANATTATTGDVGNVVVRAGGQGAGFGSNSAGGSGGGGAAGPGGVGGSGAIAGAVVDGSGGGGAGNTGGAGGAGVVGTGGAGGAGGVAGDGTAGGTGGVGSAVGLPGSKGSGGGGGGAGANNGGAGGLGVDSAWSAVSAGPGGGGGGAGGNSLSPSGNGGNGGLCGGGGGGGGWRPGTAVGGTGGGGCLVLTP